MILLDTHAAIWVIQGHKRARPLEQLPRLYLSPATILELQYLAEVGRVRFAGRWSATTVAADQRWRVDDPPSARWFAAACEIGWTRDPFDRLLAAHARLRNWTLATADEVLLERLPPSQVLRL